MIAQLRIALSIAVLLSGVQASAGSLETLMVNLAEVEERRARFVEKRTLGVLDEPLVTEGTLSYQAPDRLIRQDLLPDPAVYALEGDRLRIVIDGREQVLKLEEEPELRAMVAPYRAIFAGDLASLDQDFDAVFAESGDRWTVTLSPKATSASQAFLENIEIRGSGQTVEKIDVHELGGDHSTMRLKHTLPPD